MDDHSFAGTLSAEIDRLVVRGHELADDYPGRPAVLADLTAFPHLLNFAGIVLLKRPVSRDDVQRIVPYTPQTLIEGLVDNNIDEGVVTEQDGELRLTDRGRAFADAVVEVQDAAVADVWSPRADELSVIEKLLRGIVHRAEAFGPPRTPSNFGLFAPVVDRPTPAGCVLRLLTAMRYWRADAHSRALSEAGLRPFEAHALNRMWDAHRGLDRYGQGFPKPGAKGVESLEARGLAVSGAITTDGIALRERVEENTNLLTLPPYAELDDASRGALIASLRSLPADRE